MGRRRRKSKFWSTKTSAWTSKTGREQNRGQNRGKNRDERETNDLLELWYDSRPSINREVWISQLGVKIKLKRQARPCGSFPFAYYGTYNMQTIIYPIRSRICFFMGGWEGKLGMVMVLCQCAPEMKLLCGICNVGLSPGIGLWRFSWKTLGLEQRTIINSYLYFWEYDFL